MLLITPDLISSYFLCPRKAYFLFNSTDIYRPTEYELLELKIKEKAFKTFCEKIEARCYPENLLQDGFPAICNVKVKSNFFDFDCKLLLRKGGKSSFGNFYYEPVIFLATNTISKENRMELAFLCLLLEKIQGKFPDKASFIDKKGNQRGVRVDLLKSSIKSAINNIFKFKEKEPPLRLNKHCSSCSFFSFCKAQAIKEDHLTLLDRVTPKQINKLEKKGIFTVKQLSFKYKPRKKNKRNKNQPCAYKPELQALAIRTEKTYIQQLPTFERKPIEIFLDIEGLPEDDFFYLFGFLLSENGKNTYYSFWADSIQEEEAIWTRIIHLLESYPEAPIYHYGSFDATAFDLLAKRYKTNVETFRKRFINVNTFIFGKIYFPTYSNGLKQLGQVLGMKWTNEKASGLQCVVWRNYWEEGREEYKDVIITYNQEDCIALKKVTDELTHIKETAITSNDLDFIQNPKKIATEKGLEIYDHFKSILLLAHNDYDIKKIKFKIDQKKKKEKKIIQDEKSRGSFVWLHKKMPKPDKTILLPADTYCFKHPDQKLWKAKGQSRRVLVDLVFRKNGVRKVIVEYLGNQGYCALCNNVYASLSFREISRQLYGHNYKSWYVFQRIEIQLPFTKINETLSGLINDRIGKSYGSEFVKDFSLYYQETENKIIDNIINSPFIHADETTVNILGESQYVWVFTTDKHVIFKLSKNREAATAKDFLGNYKGVLISDFFAGYDGIECEQQKCWVHLIRDLNNGLWENPFDKEYEDFVAAIRNLLVPIIQEAQKFGLKKRYLSKYQKCVDEFYKNEIDDKVYKSEPCILYQKRLKRYRNSLFTFIKHDGVNWHNNAAENGIRHICIQRKISNSFGGNQFPHYLRMVSIMQTCKLQKKSFLKFLLSKEKDIDKFDLKRKKETV